MEEQLGLEWYSKLFDNITKKPFINLQEFINGERKTANVFPPKGKVFNSFRLTPFSEVNVVIWGLDPYIHKLEATGISFGISKECKKIPFSLKEIRKEVENEYSQMYSDNTLESWCSQGVLMLNSALTVEENKTKSHLERWGAFINFVVSKLNEKNNLIHVLMGKDSQNRIFPYLKDNSIIINTPHPAASAYNRNNGGLTGTNVFKKINEELTKLNKRNIIW